MGTRIGSLNVRRSVFIRATPERVWREFATIDRLSAWFGRGHTLERFEPTVGGTVELSVDIDGTPQTFGGRLLVFDPGREMTFEDNWHGSMAWPAPTFITLRLTPLYDGTHVELFHHGFERLGADAPAELEGYEGGWDTRHLTALRAIVEQ